MIILNKPYVSQLLQSTLSELNIPVLNSPELKELDINKELNLLEEYKFLQLIKEKSPLLLYCNSENAINWITRNLSFTDIPGKIQLVKDKYKFRELLQALYPDFFFKEINCNDIDKLDISQIKKPFIIKPNVGFLSLGVYKVCHDIEWPGIIASIKKEVASIKELFPKEVVDVSSFIIEEYIEGDEFAVDAYYTDTGTPVILNILKHPFATDTDVSDRLYFTSKQIIEAYLHKFQEVLTQIGNIIEFKNFPIHIELRVNSNGVIMPIEINPMRFAGWCSTDIAYYAYGINIYEYYFQQKRPDWDKILKTKEKDIFGFVITEIPKHIDPSSIKSIDYNKLCSYFSRVFELRKIDYKKYPLFAFIFVKAPGDFMELDTMLKKDLTEFIELY